MSDVSAAVARLRALADAAVISEDKWVTAKDHVVYRQGVNRAWLELTGFAPESLLLVCEMAEWLDANAQFCANEDAAAALLARVAALGEGD